MSALLDFLPLLGFFVSAKSQGILFATAVLLGLTVVVHIIHFVRQKRLTRTQAITLALTVLFCGLTLALHDDVFVRYKSVVINAIFATALAISALINKPILQMLMRQFFALSMRGWRNLSWAWAGYFLLMACLHYYFAFHTSDSAWISFKTYGSIPFLLAFVVSQCIFLRKHLVLK